VYTGTAYTGATEEYDGNSWTSSNPLNTARRLLAGAGTQTAGLSFWWFYFHQIQPQMQQKNMMAIVGQILTI
jgi:hypothetical protein